MLLFYLRKVRRIYYNIVCVCGIIGYLILERAGKGMLVGEFYLRYTVSLWREVATISSYLSN